MILKSVKIRLELNNKQKTMALKHSGTARHAYNWGLNLCQKSFQNKDKIPSAIDLHKKLVKEVKSEHSWYYDSSKCSPQQALRNLETAYRNFYNFQKKHGFKKTKTITKKGIKILVLEGLPQFKKRGIKDSFYLEGTIQTNGNKIKLPKFGWIKCSENLPDFPIKNVSISRIADDWFISFKIEHKIHETKKEHDVVGIDLGIKTLATLSTGVVFESIKPYKNNKRKLKLLQRKQSKKYKEKSKEQSNNYKKAATKVAKLHRIISNLRLDYTHKLTSYLAKNHSEIVIEDLNVKGMSKNHKIASAILDGGFFEFRRQIQYKCQWYGSKMTIVSRFYPSSKTCSDCGHKKQTLKLSERTFKCECCGMEKDRDLNASLNLKNMAVSSTVKIACGGAIQSDIKSEASMKQEINSKGNFA